MLLQMAGLTFVMGEQYCLVCLYYIFFIHLLVDGHLGLPSLEELFQ
jgi:hypothetical protein